MSSGLVIGDMYSTANMALTSWDQPGDDFDHTQLNANWVDIDQHDHTSGKGVQISTAGIAPSAITSGLIASGAVTNAKLGAASVGTSNIQNGAITNALLAAGSVSGAAIASGAITYDKLESTVLPIGTVLLYFRGPGSSSLPGGGWEIMDGRPWSGISNTLGLSTGNIPDMRGAFPQGADVTASVGPAIGATGGANTVNLAHTHMVNQHSHPIPGHTHVINGDGFHTHTWNVTISSNSDYPNGLNVSGLNAWYRTNSFVSGLTIKDVNNTNRQNVFGSLYLKNAIADVAGPTANVDIPANLDGNGVHTHGGRTEASAPFSTTASNATTDTQLSSSTSVVPKNVGLLFIMRVR